MILSGADDSLLKVTSLANQKPFFVLNNHTDIINSARFSPDSRLICSSSLDNTVKLFDVNQKRLFHTFDKYTHPVRSVRFHPDGTCIATAGGDREVNVSIKYSFYLFINEFIYFAILDFRYKIKTSNPKV